jgi:hypothetical protein
MSLSIPEGGACYTLSGLLAEIGTGFREAANNSVTGFSFRKMLCENLLLL